MPHRRVSKLAGTFYLGSEAKDATPASRSCRSAQRPPTGLFLGTAPARCCRPAMFTIIGGDGKEYGPATAEQLRSWINAGRANLETKAKLAGETEFRRLGDFPEFGGPATPTEPPPLAGNFNPAPNFAPAAAACTTSSPTPKW